VNAVTTIEDMGRKKKAATGTSGNSGAHKKPRTSVNVPDEWLVIARKRASANRQPVLWYLLGLVHRDATEAGIADLPPLPWEEKEGDDE
jgi:hypothetical protein